MKVSNLKPWKCQGRGYKTGADLLLLLEEVVLALVLRLGVAGEGRVGPGPRLPQLARHGGVWPPVQGGVGGAGGRAAPQLSTRRRLSESF